MLESVVVVVEESIAFVVIKDDEDRTFLVISTKKNKIAIVNISAIYIYLDHITFQIYFVLEHLTTTSKKGLQNHYCV